jgi:SAM-dependent methyltransferase
MPLTDDILAERKRVAARYLTGRGIEIGALDAPTPLPEGATARYVDFRTVEELHRQYPELDAKSFVHVDVVDNGERLEKLADAATDFLIANHMLEHCENPLGTLRNHLRKVAPGGWLFYAMPDMRCCFDSVRPLTAFEHLVADDADDGRASRHAHYVEWAKLVNKIDDDDAAAENARQNMANGYSIHYHVWDGNSWLDFLCHAREFLGRSFEIRHFELSGPEMISVLRRS